MRPGAPHPQWPADATGRARPRWTLAAAVGMLVVAVGACTGTNTTQVEVRSATTERSERTTTTKPPDCADMLPPEARAAQLLMTMVTSPTLATDAIAGGTVGGFGLKGNQTADIGDQVATAVADAPLPATVAADEEGGTVQRLRLALGKIPSAEALGTGTPEEAATTLGEHAAGMKELGFTMNFGPVADVGSGSGLGTRSFGDDPAAVSSFVNAVVAAQTEAGITSVVKHWPGIGSGGPDPHDKLPTLAPVDELRAEGPGAVRPGHRGRRARHHGHPRRRAGTDPGQGAGQPVPGRHHRRAAGPAGLHGRGHHRFAGHGRRGRDHPQDEAAELAITAGADIALVSGADAVPAAHARLVDAITTGRIPSDQVLASVRRVLAMKGVDGTVPGRRRPLLLDRPPGIVHHHGCRRGQLHPGPRHQRRRHQQHGDGDGDGFVDHDHDRITVDLHHPAHHHGPLQHDGPAHHHRRRRLRRRRRRPG